VESTATNTASRIPVGSCVAVLLAVEALAYNFRLIWFLDFDFGMQQRGEFENIVRIVSWFKVNEEKR